jgi:uncharacterized membrane protein YraQ (UPF0718 family)
MSTESVLATMFASPTLNVLVLGMSFALFPGSVALLKLATVLLLIFVFAPYSREQPQGAVIACPIEMPVSQSWSQALLGVAQSYAKSFWYVFRFAFPLMLLAALLGALVVKLLPAQALIAQVSLGGIVLVALVATFLAVPMAFDVAIAHVALTRGVPLPYVVTILCTLGIVSVYSLFIIGKSISWKVAAAAYTTVATLGTLAGLAARSIA